MDPESIIQMLVFTAGAVAFLTAVIVSSKSLAGGLPYTAILAGEAVFSIWIYLSGCKNPAAISASLALFAIFVLAPVFVNYAARRLSRADRFEAASNLLLFGFPLVPSAVAWLDLQALRAFGLAKKGDFEAAAGLLQSLRENPLLAPVRPRADEVFMDLCTRDFRWERAADFVDSSPESFERSAEKNPRLLVYALRAKCELGRLREAAGLLAAMAFLTPSKLGHGDLASAYMIFLACAGETARLKELFDSYGPHLEPVTPAIRETWLGRASAVSGDLNGSSRHFAAAADMAAREQPELLRRIDGQKAAADAGLSNSGPVEYPWPPPLPAGPAAAAARPFDAGQGKRALVSTALLAAILAASFLTWVSGDPEDPYLMVSLGANVRFLVEAGQVWRLGSSTLLHYGLLHLAMNALGLILVGRMIEALFGPARFLTIWTVSGIAGSAASCMLSEGRISLGASGAVMGLIGAGAAFMLAARGSVPPKARRMYLFLFVFIIGADALMSSRAGYVDHFAHMGGFAAGLLSGLVLAVRGAAGSGLRKAADASAAAMAVLSGAVLAACAFFAVSNHFSGGVLPGAIEYREQTAPGGAWSVPVPAFLGEAERAGAALHFRSPFINSAMETHEGPIGALVSGEAMAGREEGDRGEGTGAVFSGRKVSSAGIEFVSFRRRFRHDLSSLTFFFSAGDSVGRLAFYGSDGQIEAFSKVADRMLEGVETGAKR